jgi:RNA polymerase sigma-70 factor (ECF subfamily)
VAGTGAEALAAADMLARFRDGDRQAFAAIVGEFETRLVQFFYRLCWDRDAAEDFTQDLFLKLLRGAGRYEPQGRLSTFIFRVATNLWIDHYRAARPKGRLYSLDQVMMSGEPQVQSGREAPSPGDGMILDEEKALLRAALQQLTEPHRLVLELAVYQELPYAEISNVLGIPVGTVKSRMHNCVRVLREQMVSRRAAGDACGGGAPDRFRAAATLSAQARPDARPDVRIGGRVG